MLTKQTADTPIENVFRLSLQTKRALEKIRIKTPRDLLYYFPLRYESTENIKTVSGLKKGEHAIIFGVIEGMKLGKLWRSRIPAAQAWLSDETGKIKIMWFHQAFLARKIPDGAYVKIVGRINEGKQGLYIANPEISLEKPSGYGGLLSNTEQGGAFFPVYPETRGLSSRWLYHAARRLLNEGYDDFLGDPVPQEILRKYHLPTLSTALHWIHTPRKERDVIAAQKRFAFEEVFLVQIARLSIKKEYEKNQAFQIKDEHSEKFLTNLSFPLTRSQEKALSDVLKDMNRKTPMSRLLSGDVGSGKTLVAAAAVYETVHTKPPSGRLGNLQAAYMVPTEILARQHFANFISFFKHTPIEIGFLTGSEARKFPSKIDPSGHTRVSRAQLLRWIAEGKIPVLVGTHSLIQEKVTFKNLALVIIDEQHRFGVMQRRGLAQKHAGGTQKEVPHLLSMTATPIPRTLALTLYGDLDLSIIDEMPPGRKPVKTVVVSKKERVTMYEKIREELTRGRQAYVVCPRIDEPDPEKERALIVKSAKEEASRLAKDIFPEFSVGLIHGKLSMKEKEETMRKFENGEIKILVATSVIEVGVNVPNATTILIEGAERFGLAQLHQLRGRVLRSAHQAYCFLLSDSGSEAVKKRLSALLSAKDGFELAEIDLSMRGEGSLSGNTQWGFSDLGMQGLKNIELVKRARDEARTIIEKGALPAIERRLFDEKRSLHLE